jgi:glycosyltransferase involved in cell wall biosynthesis
VKRLLMVAFHYPPFQGSSGVLRTWNFSRYLPRFGWQPLVVTAAERAYPDVRSSAEEGALRIPENVTIERAFALDAARHFAIAGRFPRWLALPDRWLSWYPAAVASALRLAKRERPQVLWSTYPIATAHLIAQTVRRRSGLPWVADFRDSMTEEHYPTDPRQHAIYRRIEQRTIRDAAAIVFTTEGTRRMYCERYRDVDPQKFHVVPNGFDEESFGAAELRVRASESARGGPMTLLHSGVLYPSERDPKPFFKALGALRRAGRLTPGDLRVVLRASGHDALIARMLEEFAITDLVELAAPIPYGAALAEMLSVDALLLLQAANSNHQIPAKLYEYLRTGRPIFALTDAAGNSAAALRAAGVDTLADIADAAQIETALPAFLTRVRAGAAPVADRRYVARFSREAQSGALAQLLDRIASK